MGKLLIKKYATAVALCLIAGMGSQANATLTFNLTEANIAPVGPYGTIAVTWGGVSSPSTALVTLTAATGYSFGDGSAIGLNLATTDVALSGFTATQITPAQGANPNFGPAIASIALNQGSAVNGWGQFNYQVTLEDGYGQSVTYMSFTLTRNSGSWANEGSILTPNNKGYSVVGHVMNIADLGDTTGYAVVPEPGTMVAGALLLLPFAASTVRFFRNRKS